MNFGMDDKTEIYAFESDDDTDSGSHETEAGAVADIIENLMSRKMAECIWCMIKMLMADTEL